jgi:hypothetical protein
MDVVGLTSGGVFVLRGVTGPVTARMWAFRGTTAGP